MRLPFSVQGSLLLALLVVVPPPPAAAQRRVPRQLVYAVGGVAVGLGVTAVYSGRGYGKSLGWCTTVRCVGIFSTATGGLVGYLIGYEMESKYRERYRLAPPLEFTGRTRLLRNRVSDFDLDQSLVAVLGDEGVELVGTGPRLEYLGQRARGLRDIADVGVRADASNLLVGTASGLYLYAVSGRTDGQRMLGGDVSAVATRGSRVAVASSEGLRVGTIVGDSVWWRGDTNALAERVADLRWENDTLLWVLTESALTGFAVPLDAPPVRLGSAEIAGPARRVTIGAGRAAVAAGAGGVYLLQTLDPTTPRVVAHWSAARYIYDVALWKDGSQVFAGAGPEGLYLLELEGGRLRPVGLVSNAGFVAALAVGPDALYVLDRTGGVLRRLETPRPALEN